MSLLPPSQNRKQAGSLLIALAIVGAGLLTQRPLPDTSKVDADSGTIQLGPGYAVDSTSTTGIGSSSTSSTPTSTTSQLPTTSTSLSVTTTTTRVSTSTTRPASTTTTQKSTTTTSSPGGTSTTIPSNAVVVTPGMNLQSLVNQHPAGTTFYLKAGTYHSVSVTPKQGNAFIGEPGTILNGGNSTRNAFKSSATNVTIQGLVVERYNNPTSEGAITGYGSGWRILNNEVRYNAGGGIQAFDGFLIQGNNVHHNEQIGVFVQGANGRIINNTIAYNNPNNRYDMAWEAGGTKFVNTTDLYVAGNNVHNNRGPGLWTDINNHRTVYENNTVKDNVGPGIMHEVSGSAVIRNNTVTNNAHGFYMGGILIANSNNVQVLNNTVSGNRGGIMGIQDDRGSWATTHLTVTGNKISYSTGHTGVLVNSGQDVTATGTIKFDNNTYTANGNTPFMWKRQTHTPSQWRNLGHDTHSTFN